MGLIGWLPSTKPLRVFRIDVFEEVSDKSLGRLEIFNRVISRIVASVNVMTTNSPASLRGQGTGVSLVLRGLM